MALESTKKKTDKAEVNKPVLHEKEQMTDSHENESLEELLKGADFFANFAEFLNEIDRGNIIECWMELQNYKKLQSGMNFYCCKHLLNLSIQDSLQVMPDKFFSNTSPPMSDRNSVWMIKWCVKYC
jgi:hypothetical protein